MRIKHGPLVAQTNLRTRKVNPLFMRTQDFQQSIAAVQPGVNPADVTIDSIAQEVSFFMSVPLPATNQIVRSEMSVAVAAAAELRVSGALAHSVGIGVSRRPSHAGHLSTSPGILLI